MWYDIVVFGVDCFGDHIGVIIIVEYAVPYYMGRSIDVLHHQTASAVFRLDLGLSDGSAV